MTNPELNPELRNLIDARLDAIDRTLLPVQISYSERRQIVAEVETQIFELVDRRHPHPTREDVLDVLAGLDPPESYVPEDRTGPVAATPEQRPLSASRGSKLSLILIGVGLALVIDVVASALGVAGREAFQSENARETLAGITIVVAALLAAVGLVRLKRSNMRRLDLPYLRIAAVFPLLFVDYLFAVAFSFATGHLIVRLLLCGAFLLVNLLALRQFWRSIPTK